MAKDLCFVANPRVRHGYQRTRLGFVVQGLSRTKQAFKDECDINNIMARFEKSGIVDHYNRFQGQYGDFTDCPEYHDAQNKVIAANEMFMTLPAKVRDRFSNDPGKFLAFVDDPRSKEEMYELGLAHRPSPPPPKADEKK